MATSNLASDKRRPGTYHTFDDTSGARGLVPVNRALALIGVKTSAGSGTVEQPTQVFNEAECDAIAGEGSILALMGKKAFQTFRKLGNGSKVFLVPIADPAGTAATFTYTVTGTATEAGDAILKLAGRTVSVPVANGDSANTVAASIETAFDKRNADMPGTCGSTTNVATFTCAVTGVNGNDISVETVSTPAGISIAAAAGVSGAGTVDITNALDSLGAADYQAIAIANHVAGDLTDLDSHLDDMWAAGKKRWRHAFVGETGSLATATTLASGTNRKENVVVSMENAGSLPGEIAAAVAAMSLTQERPSHNWDGTELPLYLPADSDVYTDAEVETALAGGVTPLTNTPTGYAKVERLVTTKTTDGGNPFENLLDFANSKTVAYYATQCDVVLARAIAGQNLNEALVKLLRDVVYDVLKQGEEFGDLHHVDDHKDEIVVEAHPTIPTRALVEIPQSVVPNAHQVDATHRLFVEGA